MSEEERAKIRNKAFGRIYHRDKELKIDADDSTDVVYYKHIYRGSFGNIGTDNKHACMQWGHWCWKQARERPLDAVRYIFAKVCKKY